MKLPNNLMPAILIGFAVFLAFFVGLKNGWFANGDPSVGLYRAEDHTELSLLPGKRAILSELGQASSLTGQYEVSDGFLYLTLGKNDVRRLQIKDNTFTFDPDALMRQATPAPPPTLDGLTEQQKELALIRHFQAPTPRPKQTFSRVVSQ